MCAGITWVLSEEVTFMSEATWQRWCERLAAAPRPLQRRGELWEWLQHQRGLNALGWLSRQRQQELEEQQVGGCLGCVASAGQLLCTALLHCLRATVVSLAPQHAAG